MAKVLIIGSGGREHALGWQLAKSDEVSDVIYAPGNAGTAEEEKARNIPIDGSKKESFPVLLDFVRQESVDMVVVGPEAPLADGIVDHFNSKGYENIFGPTRRASLLESDKFFSFDLMKDAGIPQADSVKCYSKDESIRAINKRTTERGIVIKARGLTGGKGVTVCDSREQAFQEIQQHSGRYGQEVLIAERLFGQEFSVFGISDGNHVSPLEISLQDHKPLLDNDKGPNTGGMGAYCPVPFANREIVRNIVSNMMCPIVERMNGSRTPYKGFLYAGMIMTENGPKVLEFNIRFGDPECQPAMIMIKSGLFEAISEAARGSLSDRTKVEFNPGAACCVVLTSQGYPENYKTGLPISGLEEASKIEGIKIFHASTKKEGDKIVTSGGRVLGVTGYSQNGIADAQRLAYEAVSKINIPGGFSFRRDIAKKALLVVK